MTNEECLEQLLNSPTDILFTAYDKLEEAYKSRMKEVWEKEFNTITIGSDGRCQCSCAHKCPLGKSGSMIRCTKEELEGYL